MEGPRRQIFRPHSFFSSRSRGIHDEHRRTAHLASAEPLERDVGVLDGMPLETGPKRNGGGEFEQLLGVLTRVVCNTDEVSFPPEQVVRKLWNAIEVDRVDRHGSSP